MFTDTHSSFTDKAPDRGVQKLAPAPQAYASGTDDIFFTEGAKPGLVIPAAV